MTNICLHIIDLQSDDIDNVFQITIYGKTLENQNIVCHVTDFKPSFYVKIPEKWSKNTFQSRIINNIKLKSWEKKYINIEIKPPQYYYDFYEYKHDFVNNCRKKDKFVKLVFNNFRSFNKYKYEIKNLFHNSNNLEDWKNICNDECQANLYETDIHPILRFIHSRNISPAGWIEISGKSVKMIDDKTFKCDMEYSCKCLNIKPKDDMDSLSDIIVASFDIECDSLTGEFPRAIKDFKSLATNIYDNYSGWYDPSFNDISKIDIVKEYIRQAFSIEDLGFKNDIDHIITENGLPQLDHLDFINIEIINDLNDSLNDKKKRDDMIEKLKILLDDNLKNDKNQNIIIKGDPIIQIGTVFYYTVSKKYVRIIQVIKPDDCDEEICDSLDEYDISVECCKDERELLLKWMKCINRYNPDMITGYNIFGFDFDYISKRVEKFGIETKFNNLGRINGYHDDMDKHYSKKCKLIKKNLSSSALGDNELKYYNMDGRVLFDVVKEIQKGHNLESYKLDNVASHFMRGKIYDDWYMSKKEDKKLWHFKTNTIGHLKSGDYITINIHSNIGEVKLLDGKKFLIYKIVDNEIKLYIDDCRIIKNKFKSLKYTKVEWCMNKDDVPPHEIFNLHKTGGPSGRAKVAKYCIQDCELCIHLINLLDIVPNNIGMSNVCLVPFSYIFLRGQGIKVTSFVSKECDVQNTRMPTLKDYKETTDGYEGAIVLEPKTGIYLNDPIAVLDYASLYPSSIIENNLSQDKYLSNDNPYLQKCRDDGTFDENIQMIEYDDYQYIKRGKGDTISKIKTGEIIKCYYLKGHRDENGEILDSGLGIIPTVLQKVLKARKDTRKLIKTEPDEFKRKVLDGLQLAYKVTANSVYGQLGAKTSSIFMKIIAACTTSVGRQRIDDADKGVKDWAKSVGYEAPEIVYGDTDSVFVKFSRKDLNGNILSGDELLKHCIRCGIEAGEFVDNKLRRPQNLEYEKTFFPFILISKKRYVGDKYEWESDVDNQNFKRTSMGIVMKRRDNAPIVKYVFGNIIEKIMIDKNFNDALNWLKNTLYEISIGKFPISYFIISKSLRGYYKNPKSIAHKVLADRIGERDPGNKPKSNDRIPYAYIKMTDYDKVFDRNSQYKSGKNKGKDRKRSILQGDRIEHPDFIHSEKLELDYSFYIENQIMNPVKQVLDLNTQYSTLTQTIFDSYIVTDDMLYKDMEKYK
jgi:DNA polymerase elongation subunit (family B)